MAIKVLLFITVILFLINGCAIGSIYSMGTVDQASSYFNRDENSSGRTSDAEDVRRESKITSSVHSVSTSAEIGTSSKPFLDDDLGNPEDIDGTNAYLAKNIQPNGFNASAYDCNRWYCSWYEKIIMKNHEIILGVVSSIVFVLLIIRVSKIRAKKMT